MLAVAAPLGDPFPRETSASMKHLSVSSSNALENWSAFDEVLRTKKVVILLDYDGTLTPIVSDPSQALLPPPTRDILVELAERFIVGVVSGRSLQKVRTFVQVPKLLYAGSHGFDIWAAHAESMRYQVAAEWLPQLSVLRDRLTERLSGIKGASVEDNTFSVSVHYRMCDPTDVQQVYEIVERTRIDFSSIRLGTGKKVFELRPDIKWDKGRAIVWLLEAMGLRGRDDVFTIYIGDDVTDEDAFQVFCDQACVAQGVGIVVTEENKDTGASYSLRNPEEVAMFLSRLLQHSRSVEHGIAAAATHSYDTCASDAKVSCMAEAVQMGAGETKDLPPATAASATCRS